MPWWKVTFEEGSSVYVEAETQSGAGVLAQFMAWDVSGKWWKVTAVEPSNSAVAEVAGGLER